MIPKHTKYLIIGAGVHGLSTAYHLGLELRASGKGNGSDILVASIERRTTGIFVA